MSLPDNSLCWSLCAPCWSKDWSYVCHVLHQFVRCAELVLFLPTARPVAKTDLVSSRVQQLQVASISPVPPAVSTVARTGPVSSSTSYGGQNWSCALQQFLRWQELVLCPPVAGGQNWSCVPQQLPVVRTGLVPSSSSYGGQNWSCLLKQFVRWPELVLCPPESSSCR